MPLALTLRIVIITFLLFVWHSTKSIPQFLILMAQAGYLFYVTFARPHKQSFDLLRSLCLEIGLLYILAIRLIETSLLQDFVDPSSVVFPIIIYI